MDTHNLQKLAFLSRITLTSEELEKISKKLHLVLDHFNKISSVNTENVEPLVTPIDLECLLREDLVIKDSSVAEILNHAPVKQGYLFKVPPVI